MEIPSKDQWNARFSAIFSAEPECVKILNREGIVLQMNPAGLSILEAEDSDQVVGHSMFDFIVPEHHEPARECFLKVLQSGPLTCRFDVSTLQGHRRTLESRLVALGEIPEGVEVLAVTRDITNLLAAEAALRESEQRFRQLAENIEDAFWMFDLASGKVIYASPGYEGLWGRSQAEVMETPSVWIDSIHVEDRERVRSALKQRELTGFLVHEYRIVRPDGEIRWIHDRTFPIRNSSGAIYRLAGIATDITNWKESEQQLTRLNRLYRFLSRTNDAILHRRGPHELLKEACEIAVEGGLLAMAWVGEISRDRQRLTPIVSAGHVDGYLDDFVIQLEAVPLGIGPAGRAFHWAAPAISNDIAHDPTFVTKPEALARGYRAAAGFPIKIRGEIRYVLIFYAQQKGFFQDGEIPLLERLADNIGFAIEAIEADATHASREAKLRQAQKMESLGLLAGGIAHDFNNILTVITGNIELAKLEVDAEGEAQETLKNASVAAARATDLVRQILTFSRRSDHQRKLIDLANVVADSVKLLRAALPKNIEIVMEVERPLPQVSADPSEMFQVIMNLATNAAQAMKGRTGAIEIGLSAVRITEETLSEYPGLQPGEHVKLCVNDNGAGMHPEIVDRIFDPFFTTKPVGEGTGLGLSVVHGIIKSHDGAIYVESELGVGSKFEALIPAARVAVVKESPRSLGKGESVLFVDDDASVCRAAEESLTWAGYVPHTFISPLEALERFTADPKAFPVVVTDVSMAEMSGIALAQEIKRLSPKTPVILLSGFTGIISPEKLQTLGADLSLTKPLSARALAETIRSALGQV